MFQGGMADLRRYGTFDLDRVCPFCGVSFGFKAGMRRRVGRRRGWRVWGGVKGSGVRWGVVWGMKRERNNPILIFFGSECQSAVFGFLSVAAFQNRQSTRVFEQGLLTMATDDIKNWV